MKVLNLVRTLGHVEYAGDFVLDEGMKPSTLSQDDLLVRLLFPPTMW